LGFFLAIENDRNHVLVAYTCNPSYSGGRDQEDHSSKPAWTNSSQDPILKIFDTKKGWCMAQVVESLPSKDDTLISSPSTTKKKKKERETQLKLPQTMMDLIGKNRVFRCGLICMFKQHSQGCDSACWSYTGTGLPLC
jgi:hypothetical protein